MESDVLAFAVLFGIAVITPVAIIGLSYIAGPARAKRRTDLTPYECGVKPFESARRRFSVKFYMVAMLFIIFDIETAILFPWAVSMNAAPQFLFAQAIVFILILAVGYVYILRKGVLNWK